MAKARYEYKIVTGEAGESLAAQLTTLNSEGGWEVAGVAGNAATLTVVLRREQNFEVGRSLQQALEEVEITDAIAREIPPEEMAG